MKVIIPSPLRSYTGARQIEATGATIAELLADLDRHHPGMRFRIVDEQGQLRPHIRLFVNGELARDLAAPLAPADEVQIVQALSGG